MRAGLRHFGFLGHCCYYFGAFSHGSPQGAGLKWRSWGPRPKDSDLVGPEECASA